jgi:hypothetical protein
LGPIPLRAWYGKKGPKKLNLIWTGIRLVCYKAIKKERKNTWQRKEQEKNKRKDRSPNKKTTLKSNTTSAYSIPDQHWNEPSQG